MIAVVALVLAVALVWFLAELFQPFHGPGHGSVTVTIPAHASASAVGDQLERDGVISSSFFFELRATLAGQRGELRSGTYHLQRDMSYGDVLKILTTPPPAAPVTSVTIIEGRTRGQVDALLRTQGVSGSYLAASRRSPLLSPAAYGAPRGTDLLEGFLFPDTYQLREPISIPALVADQLTTFRQRFATVGLGYARSKHLTAYDVLIIASMVQAEAQTARDRPLIASVIYNRLAAGIPLGIDATTRYATNNYTSSLTSAQLHSPSPYNTRIHVGLPPTPIDSPGLASIEAAAHPATTNYLYFVVKVCGNGAHAFAPTYARFLTLVKQYDVARARRGGRSPENC
jgi:peptidoglycan lytic transglycosylase G